MSSILVVEDDRSTRQLLTEVLKTAGFSVTSAKDGVDALERLRAGAYELIARADVPVASVISEYVDVAHAFYDKRESGFVNGLLDAIAKEARPARAE